MNIAPRFSLTVIILLIITSLGNAQGVKLKKNYKAKAVKQLCKLMIDYYVFPDVAKKTEEHLLKQLNSGHFDQFTNDDDFAAALTESVQSINKDKHMRIRKNRPYKAPDESPERLVEEKIDRLNRSRRSNLGFHKLEMLEGNVGYLDLRGFAGMERGKAKADSYMKLMAEADAIIIDLSKNGGGSPNMVQYLCSFFFDEKLHLNSLYYRENNETKEYWTLDEVGGSKMPEVPLFIITADRTFSAAEEFSYNMQTQKRATLVGQTTGGGANPGGTRSINKNLSVFIPSGTAINPITKTNWEGVGVIPEVKTSSEEAKAKAHELAMEAASKFREAQNEKWKKMLMNITTSLDSYEPGNGEETIISQIKECVQSRMLYEWDINELGYDFLLQSKKPKTAELLFRVNTILFPESANVHDSYGEILVEMGQIDEAVKSYEKAVMAAEKNKDSDLPLYEKNLAKVRKKLK